MNSIIKKFTILAILSVLLISLITPVFAHPGSLDWKGGHYNRRTGEYHYHHGYSAHQHTNGECPYDFKDNANTEYNPNANSSSSSSSYTPSEPTTREQTQQNNSTKNKNFWYRLKHINFSAFAAIALLTFFLIFIMYTFISGKLNDLKTLKKNRDYIYNYCDEYINAKPLIKKKKIINTRYEKILNEIKQNKIDIKKCNLQNIDLYILSRHLPNNVELDCDFNIIYKDSTQEKPFGKFTVYSAQHELHLYFDCAGGLPHNSLKTKDSYLSNVPLCKKCISKYKEMDIEDYFDPSCDKRRPIYSKKDLPVLFAPHWYTLYQKFITDANKANLDLSSFKITKNIIECDAPSMERLLSIFRWFPDSYEDHIDETMLQFLSERYSLIRQLKNNDIKRIIKNVPGNVHINSDFSIEVFHLPHRSLYGEYTTYLQKNILHRTKHFDGECSDYISFKYKDEIRAHCKLCEDCWSEISAEKKDKILNPKWYNDLIELKKQTIRLDIKEGDYIQKKQNQQMKPNLRAGYAAMIKWLKEKGFIEDSQKTNTNGTSFSFFDNIPETILITKDNKIVHADSTIEKLYGDYTVFVDKKSSLLHKNKSCCKNKECFRSYCLPEEYKTYNLCPRCWNNTDKNALSDLFYPPWYNTIQKLLSDVIIFDCVTTENIDLIKKINRIFNSDIYINLHQLSDVSLLLIDFKNNVLIDSNKKIYHIGSTNNFTFGKYTFYKELLQRTETYHTFPHKYSGITEQVPSYKAKENPWFHLCIYCEKKLDNEEYNELISPHWYDVYKNL